MKIVKTWSENKKETKQYLKYNNYGNIALNIPATDIWVCVGDNKPIELKDVKIIK